MFENPLAQDTALIPANDFEKRSRGNPKFHLKHQ
jgi:hypothetical protein